MNIEIADLTRRFGRTRAVAGVNLEAGPGVFGLLGPNGAGKTSLLRMMATALPPTSGTMRLLGRDPGAYGPRREIRRRLGYLPQTLGYYPAFTVADFVEYFALLKDMPPKQSHASQHRTGRVTLLERKTALDALAEIAAQARGGEGRLVLVEGEAGVGKSALLEQFTRDLPDSRLLSGACDGMFTPRPLGPLFDIAQQVHGRLYSLGRANASRSDSSTRSLPSYASRDRYRLWSSKTCIGPTRPPSICWAISRGGSARSPCY